MLGTSEQANTARHPQIHLSRHPQHSGGKRGYHSLQRVLWPLQVWVRSTSNQFHIHQTSMLEAEFASPSSTMVGRDHCSPGFSPTGIWAMTGHGCLASSGGSPGLWFSTRGDFTLQRTYGNVWGLCVTTEGIWAVGI